MFVADIKPFQILRESYLKDVLIKQNVIIKLGEAIQLSEEW